MLVSTLEADTVFKFGGQQFAYAAGCKMTLHSTLPAPSSECKLLLCFALKCHFPTIRKRTTLFRLSDVFKHSKENSVYIMKFTFH